MSLKCNVFYTHKKRGTRRQWKRVIQFKIDLGVIISCTPMSTAGLTKSKESFRDDGARANRERLFIKLQKSVSSSSS